MPANAGTAYVDVKADWSGLNREISKRGPAMAKAFGGQFGKALGPVMSQQAKHVEAAWRGVKIGAVAGAAAVAYGFKDVVEKGAAFEKQMSVNAAVSEASTKQLEKLEKQSIKLGQATFYSAGQAAEAQGELVKGGLSVQQVLGGGLPAALSLAEAGQLDLATAATTTVNAMKLFGLSGKEASSVADMLSTAANKTTADVIDFSMALKQGGSVSKLAGYSMNETVTVLEALAEAGIKNSDAGTSMKTSIIQLLKPSEKQAKLQKLLGLDILTQNGHLKNAAGLSAELRRATEGMTKAERTKTLAILAGTDGVRTLNALYDQGPKKLEALERANAKQGTAQEIAAKKMDNLAGEIEQFKGSVETAEISIYQGMAPALKELAGEATEAANKVGSIFENDNLSGSEKIEKSFELVSHELGRLWDENEMTDHIVNVVDKAIPIIAERAGQAGLTFAEGFAKGFVKADPIAKIVMGAWLINFIGGKAAFVGIGKTMGRSLGLSIGQEAAKTAAPIIATETAIATAAATPKAAAAASGSMASSAWLGSAAVKREAQLASHAQAFGSAGMFGAAVGIPNLEKEMAARGAAGGRSFVGGLASKIKGGVPQVTSSLSAMGPRLLRGVTTWGLGGFVVGEMTKEIVGGEAGQEIGSAIEGAGLGAVIGSAIAPGIGTAIGAALGGTGGLIASALAEDGESMGDEMAQKVAAGFEKQLPGIEKMIRRMDLGSVGQELSIGRPDELTKHGLLYHSPKAGASGLRGLRTELGERLGNAERYNVDPKVIDALRSKLQLVNVAIAKGTDAMHSYKQGFELLKSGLINRMGDISKITQENIATINRVWKDNPPKWHKAMAQSMQASIAAVRSGMNQNVIDTETGQARIKALTRNMHLFEGRDPLGIAEGFAKGWKEAGSITERQIAAETKQLNKMPKARRDIAREAMVGMAREMESKGQLVKGSAARLNSALTTKFGRTNQQLEHGVAAAMANLAESVAGGATNVSGALGNIQENLAHALEALGSSKIPGFRLTAAASQYHHLRESTQNGFGGQPQGRQAGGPIPGTFTVPGSGSGDKVPLMLPPGSFIENREAARLPFRTGGLTPVIAEPEERVWLPPSVQTVGLAQLERRNAEIPRFQQGGLHGKPQISGPAGPVLDIAQRATGMAWSAAQDYLQRHRPKGGFAGLGNGPSDLKAAMVLAQKMGLTITSTTGGQHTEDSWHYKGRAFDASNGTGTPQERAYAIAAAKRWGSHILELFYDPLGWYIKNGQKVSGAIGGHSDHVHTAMQRGGLLAAVQKLASGGSVKGPWAGTSIDKTYPTSDGTTGEKLPDYVIAALAEWAGMPGITMDQITMGESMGHPGVDVSDPPGRSRGLYAINDHYNPKYGATAMRNPIFNTLAAGDLAAAAGGPNANIWHGSSHVTGWNLHYKGDPEKIAQHLGGGGADAPDTPKQETGPYTTHKQGSTSQGGGTYAEDEIGHYKVQTAKLSFDSLPDNLTACTRELRRRQRELGEYRAAAKKTKNASARQAYMVNAKLLSARISALRKQRGRLIRQEAAKKVLSKIKAAANFSKWTAEHTGIFARREEAFNIAQEFAENAVTLEPEEPATGATGDWVNNTLKSYVDGVESPAYARVLGAEGAWRNSIIEAEGVANARVDSWGQRIQTIKNRIAEIESYKQNKPRAWKKWKGEIPNLRAQIKALRADIDQTHSTTLPEWESSLGGVQGLARTHEMIADLAPVAPDVFGGEILGTKMTIKGLGLKVSQALAGITPDEGNSEALELQKELTRQANQRAMVSDAQRNTIADFNKAYPLPPYAGKAHTGAVVPGPPGQERTMVVKTGEGIFTQEQMAAMGTAGGNSGGGLVIETLIVQEDGSATARMEGQDVPGIVRKVIREETSTRSLASTKLR